MATNKNATIRYKALDRCFRNPGKKYFIEDLMEACNEALLEVAPDSSGVQKRQIYDDIKFMKDSKGFEAPIESFHEGKRKYYRYSDLSFSIDNQPLNELEAQQLRETLMTLSRFRGLPQFEWVEEMKVRLEQTLHLKPQNEIISFEENPYLSGREFIGDLYNAIVNKQPLKITYHSFKKDDRQIIEIHPYFLKQYNNRWFLLGFNEKFGNIQNLALDRIQSIATSSIPYRENEKFDFQEYFSDVIGVTIPENEKPIKITLKIMAALWPYVKTKPIHESQKRKEENESFAIIEVEIIPTFEFFSKILSLGAGVEVVKPDFVRRKIISEIDRMKENY